MGTFSVQLYVSRGVGIGHGVAVGERFVAVCPSTTLSPAGAVWRAAGDAVAVGVSVACIGVELGGGVSVAVGTAVAVFAKAVEETAAVGETVAVGETAWARAPAGSSGTWANSSTGEDSPPLAPESPKPTTMAAIVKRVSNRIPARPILPDMERPFAGGLESAVAMNRRAYPSPLRPSRARKAC